MIQFLGLIIALQSVISAEDCFSIGGGIGSSYFTATTNYYVPSNDIYFYNDLGLRTECEIGYYNLPKRFNAVLSYGGTLFPGDDRGVFVDQQATLLGEYILVHLNSERTRFLLAGAGPSLRLGWSYYRQKQYLGDIEFYTDSELALVFLLQRHLMLRGQATYSFSPIHPLSGVFLNLTLRFCYTS